MFMEIFNNIKGIKNKISVENIVMERVFYQTKIKIFLFVCLISSFFNGENQILFYNNLNTNKIFKFYITDQ